MRSEEPPEDRRLLTVKSWFSRSSSGVSFQNDLVDAAADGNSSSVSVSKEGVLESGPGFAPLRQLSMRRTRPSEEIERDSGAGSPSMTSRNITPVAPLTPLRWKSNLREQEEQEKSMERSRLGMPCGEEDPRGKLTASNGQEDRAAEGQQEMPGAAAHDQTKSADELSPKALSGDLDEMINLEPIGGLDRKPSSAGDDVMTMTIEFLRARLLSERSASKAAKLRAQQLATKVFELEQKLDEAVADRKKSEVAAQEAVEKLKLAESSSQGLDTTPGEVSERSISNSSIGSSLLRSRADQEDTRYLLREMSGNKDLSRLTSYGSSVEDRECTTKMQLPENGSKVERRSAEQDRPGMKPTLQNMAGRLQESPQIQDSKDAIESRLRNMWSKISEEMAALTEERSEKDVVREEVMRWMGQVPSILQNVIPKKLANLSHNVVCSETESTAPELVENCPEVSPQSLPDKSQPLATANRAALLQEQFAAQENVQQEWERNYHETQRKLEKFAGDDRNANKSPRTSAGHQHVDHMLGPNGVAENPSFFESPHGLAKSKSSLDLPTRPSEHSLYRNSRHHDGSYAKADTWNRERPWGQETGSRRPDPVHQSTIAQRPFPHEVDHLNHSRMHEERSFAPPIFQEAGQEAWPERQLAQETGSYYQDGGNRTGYLSRAEWGPPPWLSTNRSEEDGLRRSQSDFRTGLHTWDDGDHPNSGRYKPAQPGCNDANGQYERDRDSGREDSHSSSHPAHTHRRRHRHQRSHSDTDDWPAVEDYGSLNQQPELDRAPGLGRRQSYSGYPAAVGWDSSRGSFDKAPDSYGDRRYSDERTHGARGQRRESFPTSKADRAFEQQQYSPQVGRNGFSNDDSPLSLGYGPAFDAPREGSPVQRSPKAGINKSISDVLLALQIAKTNIQKGGAGAKEQRSSGDQASLKTGYGMEPSAQYMRQGVPQQSSQAPSSKTLRPASRSGKYDPYEADFGSDRYQSESDATGGTNADTSYADQLNVGKGIQFFFP